MNTTLARSGRRILARIPGAAASLRRAYRFLRTGYLQTRHPRGAFVTCNGARVFCDFRSENYQWYDGDSLYLGHELETFVSLFAERPPGVILDIGAHWGFYSAFLNTTTFAGRISRIISVEPDPVNCAVLAKTLAAIDRIPVSQVDAAIAAKDGYTSLYAAGGTCKQTYHSPHAVLAGSAPAVSLDSLVEGQLQPGEVLTHVKLDIDGHEPAFFAGGERTLKTFRPIILMEFWAKGLIASGCDLDAYWNMLQENYRVQEVSFASRSLRPLERDGLPSLVARTTDGITNLVLTPRSS